MTDTLTIESLCAGLGAPERVLRFADIPGGEVVFGVGKLAAIGGKAVELGARRVLLVTDPGLRAAGHEARCREHLQAAGLEVFVFDEVHENPTTNDVDRCVEAARGKGIDLVVGLGGGSSLDTAKGCNFLLTNGGRMQDYWGVGKATRPMLPLIAAPTTAGTGSECQSFALIAAADTHVKMACGDKKAAAAVSILDPALTLTQPRTVTAQTGIDAIAHALETAVCNKRTDISLSYSRIAWRLLDGGIERVLTEPDDLDARARMQLGAAFAGTAIENSMLGAAHACANPLTARFGVVHGQAVGVMLPHVIRFNRRNPASAATYRELGGERLDRRIQSLLETAGLKTRISDLGVSGEDLGELANFATTQWTAQFNPVPLDRSGFEQLYRAAL